MNKTVKTKSLNLNIDKSKIIVSEKLCDEEGCKNKKEWFDYCHDCAVKIMKNF